MGTMTLGKIPMAADYRYRKLVNNTKVKLDDWMLQEICWAMNDEGRLPEELSDLFVLTLADNGNWILTWA